MFCMLKITQLKKNTNPEVRPSYLNCVIFNIQNMFVKMPYNVLQMKYCKLTFITIEKMFHKWNDLNSILKIKCDFITFTSSFALLLELIVLRSVYFLVKFRFFIQELWERKSLQIYLNSILKIKCDFITFYKWNGSARCVHKLYITLISQH
jgi:hypothetical protein